MKNLNEDLKTGEYQPMYLLYGEERFLKKMYKNRLIDGIRGEDNDFNYNYFEGNKIDEQEVVDLAETLPFFADSRLIVIENSGLFKRAAGDLAEYLDHLSETTHIVFVEEEVDKRGKLFKLLKSQGRVTELTVQKTEDLCRWIGGLFKKDEKRITAKTAQYLIEKVGDDMFRLQSEVEKLIAYTRGRDMVTEADIEAICITQITNQIFDMVDAVANKNQKKALEYYYDLLALKEPPMRILFMLARQFRILYQVKSSDRSGLSNAEIGKKCGVPPFAVKKYQAQGKHFNQKHLRSIIEEAAEIEESVKTGRITDKLAVEVFIVKYSMA